MKFKEKFIKEYSKYIHEKYFLSRLFEEKYINKFADIEIENMQNLYDYLIIDSKIANRFIYPTKDSIEVDILNQLVDEEFVDLYKQIEDLKLRKRKNRENLSKSKEYTDSETLNKIKFIVQMINPNINSTKIAEIKWKHFINQLEADNLEIVDDLVDDISNMRIRDKDFTEEDYKKLYKSTKKDLSKLSEFYPNNLERIFDSKKNIEKKYNEVKADLKNSKEALENITSMYLQIYDSEGLES